jgi:hypothetical protein
MVPPTEPDAEDATGRTVQVLARLVLALALALGNWTRDFGLRGPGSRGLRPLTGVGFTPCFGA